SSHTHILTTIGMFQWYYLTRIATHKQLIGMSLLSRNYGYYDLSISAANKLDTRILYLSFPAPYLNYYSQFSQKMGISSAYLLAISRQESRFNASIVAFDGGQGLMQIMPNTAKYISRKSRYQICSLLTAPCNIKYGSWYLGNLYNKFGSYIYASAGYNGGPNRAMRWQKNLANLDNRIQIEMIPISITRGYIQKVLVNKAIYDIKFNGSNKLDMLNYVINLKNAPHNINNLNDDKTDAIKL
ncbi:MAG: lytic transglycosylase domain-containing protein, partial [Neisseriaceae bacterium]